MTGVITCMEQDAGAVAQRALGLLMSAADKAIASKGRFVLILAGGNTPNALYKLLRNQPADWSKWLLLYGDERCLPCDHTERNSLMVQQAWLDAVAFPAENHFIIPAEKGAAVAAQDYGKAISHCLPADFALLGIGEDGHTASLFPGNLARDRESNDLTIAVKNSPKPPAERVSLSYHTLNKTSTICFLASGECKREILKEWQNNQALPFNHIHGAEKTFLITDIQPA